MPLKLVVEFSALDAGLLVNDWLKCRQALIELQRGDQPVQAVDVAEHLGWPVLKAHEALAIGREKRVIEHCGAKGQHRGGFRWLPITELPTAKPLKWTGRRGSMKPARIGRVG